MESPTEILEKCVFFVILLPIGAINLIIPKEAQAAPA